MFSFADFVKATTTTEGTGDITLGSSPTGFRSFAQGFADQDVMDVLVVDNPSAPVQWEVFEATYNDLATDTLTRGTLRSSSTGSRINFSAGTKTVVAAPSALFYDLIAQSINANIDATGSSGAYAVTTPAGLTPTRGYRITFKANHDNPSGGTTINPDTLGADAIKMSDGSDPYAGAIKNGGLYTVEFDGTNFQLLNPTAEVVQPTWERLTSGIVSAASELDITDIPSDAERVVISIDGYVPSVDSGIIVLLTSSDNGSSFDSGASDYAHARISYTVSGGAVSPNGSDATPGITMVSSIGNSGTEQLSMKIEIQAPGSTLNYKTIYFSGFYQNTNFVTVSGHGRRLSTSAVDAVRLIPGSGNFTFTYDVWVLRS